MSQPNVNLVQTPLDGILDKMLFMFMALIFIIPLMYFDELPNEIPIHFNAKGEVDNYGSRYTLFILPFIQLVTGLLLWWLKKRPQIFNYWVKITDLNAEVQYKMAQRFMSILNLIMAVMFTYIEFMIVKMSIDESSTLKPAYVFFFVALILSATIIYVVKSVSQNKT